VISRPPGGLEVRRFQVGRDKGWCTRPVGPAERPFFPGHLIVDGKPCLADAAIIADDPPEVGKTSTGLATLPGGVLGEPVRAASEKADIR
jgi:hypothetical protein